MYDMHVVNIIKIKSLLRYMYMDVRHICLMIQF